MLNPRPEASKLIFTEGATPDSVTLKFKLENLSVEGGGGHDPVTEGYAEVPVKALSPKITKAVSFGKVAGFRALVAAIVSRTPMVILAAALTDLDCFCCNCWQSSRPIPVMLLAKEERS